MFGQAATNPFSQNITDVAGGFNKGFQGAKQNQMMGLQVENMQAEQSAQAEAATRSAKARQMWEEMAKTGDTSRSLEAAALSPEYSKQMLEHVGIDDKRKALFNAKSYQATNQFLKNGDRQGAIDYLQRHAAQIDQRGGNSQDTRELLQKIASGDDNGALSHIRAGAAALEGSGYVNKGFTSMMDMLNAKEQHGVDMDLRKQDHTEESYANDDQFRRQKHAQDLGFAQQRHSDSMNLSRQQMHNQSNIASMRAAHKNRLNDLKQQELQMKIDKRKHDLSVDKADRTAAGQTAVMNIDNMLNGIDSVLQTPQSVMDDAMGPVSQMLPTLSQDVANFEEQVGTIDSQAFLSQVPQMKGLGALTEAEGQKLTKALQNLSLRQSPDVLRDNLKEAQRLMQKSRKYIMKKHGLGDNLSIPDTPNAADISGDEVNSLLQKYGY